MKRTGFSVLMLWGLFYLLNFNSLNAQDLAWAVQFPGTKADDGRSVAVDPSGNVYTAGTFMGTVDFDPGPASHTLTTLNSSTADVFICKLDPSGNFLWAVKLGGEADDGVYGIAVDDLGNVYSTGYFQGTADFDPGSGYYPLHATGSGYYSDSFISKLDASGNFVWAKQLGGTNTDEGRSISLDASGNIYTTGTFYETADFDPGPGSYNLTSIGLTDIYISKLDASGNFIWAKQIGGTTWDNSHSIRIDGAGNIYTAGFFTHTVDFDPGPGIYNLVTGSNESVFISKLDASGNFAWAKQLDGTFQNKDVGLALDENGNTYTTASFFDSTDFDPGAGTHYLTSAGADDAFICKLNASGNFVWAKKLGGDFYDESSAITLDASGNVYTTGFFYGMADFDPGPGTYNLTPAALLDIFISKLDTAGNFVWARQLGGAGFEYTNSIALDPSGNVYTTGRFEGTADFDPGAAIYNLVSAGDYDIFVHKMSQNVTAIPPVISPDITVSPNPTTGKFMVTIPSLKEGEFTMKLISQSGLVVAEGNYYQSSKAGNYAMNIASLPSGIYTLLIQLNNTVIARKVVLSR